MRAVASLLLPMVLRAQIFDQGEPSSSSTSEEEGPPFVVGSGDTYPSGNYPEPSIVLNPAIWELSRTGVQQVGEDSQGCDGKSFLDFVDAADVDACVDACRANSRCGYIVFYGSDPRSYLHDYYDPNSPLCKLVQTCDEQSSTAKPENPTPQSSRGVLSPRL